MDIPRVVFLFYFLIVSIGHCMYHLQSVLGRCKRSEEVHTRTGSKRKEICRNIINSHIQNNENAPGRGGGGLLFLVNRALRVSSAEHVSPL